jgi:hypothetical protein
MNRLLDAAIIPRGGMDRWNVVRSIDVTSGALRDLKGLSNTNVEIRA